MKRAVPFTMKPMSDLTPPFGPDDVEILERDTPFQGFFRVDTLTLRHKQYNGVKSCWWSSSGWGHWSGGSLPGVWS